MLVPVKQGTLVGMGCANLPQNYVIHQAAHQAIVQRA